jgi:hypothetical protein
MRAKGNPAAGNCGARNADLVEATIGIHLGPKHRIFQERIDFGLGNKCVRVLLAGEGFDMALAGLAGVVAKPSLALFAGRCFPCALSDGHCVTLYSRGSQTILNSFLGEFET